MRATGSAENLHIDNKGDVPIRATHFHDVRSVPYFFTNNANV